MRTYKLGQGRDNSVVRYKKVIAVAKLSLGLKGFILALQLRHPDHLCHSSHVLLLYPQLSRLVTLTCQNLSISMTRMSSLRCSQCVHNWYPSVLMSELSLARVDMQRGSAVQCFVQACLQ